MISIEDIKFYYKKDAEKFFRKHEAVRQTFKVDVVKVINRDHTEQVNVKPLQGRFKGYSRIAIGGYRIIYKIENGEIIVVDVAYAGSRGDVYKRFQG